MASSRSAHARRPALLVLLSLLVFLALDNGLYRDGLYTNVMTTRSVPGHFAAVARWCIATKPSAKKEVLVLGHSKIEAALSARQFDQENPDSHLRLVMGSSGGTMEKMWFYFLKHIDPDRNRYAAVVIPQDTYRTPPLETDMENQISVAQILAPMLDARDWIDLLGTYTDPNVKSRVLAGALASSHLYAVDLQDLLLHPQERQAELAWAKATAATALYDWDGYDGDLDELVIDREAKTIVRAPKHLDAFRRGEAEFRLFTPPNPEHAREWTDKFQAFRERWIRRMIDYYAGSETKLVFVQVPRWPFDMKLLMPLEGAPSMLDFVKPSANVVVIGEHEFEDLEAPHYFYDVLHVNRRARKSFTHRFGEKLRAVLGDAPR